MAKDSEDLGTVTIDHWTDWRLTDEYDWPPSFNFSGGTSNNTTLCRGDRTIKAEWRTLKDLDPPGGRQPVTHLDSSRGGGEIFFFNIGR